MNLDFNNNGFQPQQQPGAGMAIASMVLGIVSLVIFCFWYIAVPCAIVGVVLGAVSLKRKAHGKGMAVAGVVTSLIAIAIAVVAVAGAIAFLSSFGL